MVWQLVLLVAFGLVLAGSASIVVKAATALARRYGITNYTFAFLLLGLLTSAPEAFVALQSALTGVPQLSMGNLIGGSILLLSLVMGASAVVLKKVTLDHGLQFHEVVLTSVVVGAPAVVLWDGRLTFFEGAALVAMYVLHAVVLNKEGHVKRLTRRAKHIVVSKQWILFLVGILGMVASSHVLVQTGLGVAVALGVPVFVFGLTFLSFGTNLPEFALAFGAVRERRRTVAFGDFLGSAAANTLILGVLGILSPFQVAASEKLRVSLILLTLTTGFFVWALSSRRDISRKEGIGLLFFYLVFVVSEFL